jgi:hypothetical protein
MQDEIELVGSRGCFGVMVEVSVADSGVKE